MCLICLRLLPVFLFFFFNDTATTEIYTLSLHDALPISCHVDKSITCSCSMSFMGTFTLFISTTRSEEHTSELQSQSNLVCRLLLEKKKTTNHYKQKRTIQYTTSTPHC